MPLTSQQIATNLRAARLKTCDLIESLGSLSLHLREGINDAECHLGNLASLSADDALAVLSEIESTISEIQAKVAACAS
jgi:hypothetical protein